MGCSKQAKKSYEDVENDLRATLKTNALALLQDSSSYTDSELEDILEKAVTDHFNDKYGFSYYDGSPPNALPGSDPVRLPDFCSVTDPNDDRVRQYIENTIMSQAGDLPEWAQAIAKADIATLATTLTAQDTQSKWHYAEYIKKFHATREDQSDWVVNASLVYVNGHLSEDALDATLCIIKFAGVFWKVESEGAAVRHGLLQQAYAAAKSTSSFGGDITNDEELANALRDYTKAKFKDNFHFDYGTKPSDAPATGQWLNITDDYLTYIQDLDTGCIPEKVRTELFGGIPIPIENIKKQAISDVIERFQSIIQNKSTNSWMTEIVDNSYGIHDPMVNPIKNRGLILYYYNHGATDNDGTEIAVSYIYYLANFTEMENPEKAITRDLYIDLCTDLRQHITGETETGMDPIALDKYLRDYGKQTFKELFGFDYDKGTPPDWPEGKKIVRKDALCAPATYPPSATAVADFVNNELFKSNDNLKPGDNPDRTFPSYAQSNIWHNTVDMLNRYLGPDTRKDGSVWYPSHHNKQYGEKTGIKDSVNEFVLYFYALGFKREDTYGGQSIQKVFCYTLGLYSSVHTSNDDDW